MNSLANFTGLSQLRCSVDDLRALAGQGSLCPEQHRSKIRYKLRFRTHTGRQVVRNVPRQLIEQVRIDLRHLQSPRHANRALRDATRTARQARRDAKRQLEPVLESLGYRLHGTSIRQKRTKQITVFSLTNKES
jgi:hypothetical protein